MKVEGHIKGEITESSQHVDDGVLVKFIGIPVLVGGFWIWYTTVDTDQWHWSVRLAYEWYSTLVEVALMPLLLGFAAVGFAAVEGITPFPVIETVVVFVLALIGVILV
jgi:hypothetical protein